MRDSSAVLGIWARQTTEPFTAAGRNQESAKCSCDLHLRGEITWSGRGFSEASWRLRPPRFATTLAKNPRVWLEVLDMHGFTPEPTVAPLCKKKEIANQWLIIKTKGSWATMIVCPHTSFRRQRAGGAFVSVWPSPQCHRSPVHPLQSRLMTYVMLCYKLN